MRINLHHTDLVVFERVLQMLHRRNKSSEIEIRIKSVNQSDSDFLSAAGLRRGCQTKEERQQQ